MTGHVIRIKDGYNFGFIKSDNTGEEYFFHRDDFNGHWNDMKDDVKTIGKVFVNFHADKTPKGLRARKVRRTEFPNEYPIEQENE